MKQEGEKIAWLTAYDYSFASLLDKSGVDGILVGDSLGMVVQGHADTIPVTVENIIYHIKCVKKGVKQAMIIGDLPFGSYQQSKEMAYQNSVRLMRAGAQVVKLEGGKVEIETIQFLTERGIAVCAHLGLTPQYVRQIGGFKVQGRGARAAQQLLTDAISIEQAGAFAVVLEAVPASLAEQISTKLSIPTIGIGAGSHCDGQVLVLYDMLGIYPHESPRFSKNFLRDTHSVENAISDYVDSVKKK